MELYDICHMTLTSSLTEQRAVSYFFLTWYDRSRVSRYKLLSYLLLGFFLDFSSQKPSLKKAIGRFLIFSRSFKVMLHEAIRNNDFQLNKALQHCCDIVSNSYNIVPTLQRCFALKLFVANRPSSPLALVFEEQIRFDTSLAAQWASLEYHCTNRLVYRCGFAFTSVTVLTDSLLGVSGCAKTDLQSGPLFSPVGNLLMGFRCMLFKGGLFFVFVCEKKMKIYFYKVSKLYIITNF